MHTVARSARTQNAHTQVVVRGTGHHLGSAVVWALRFRRDGAFREEIRSKHLSFAWGCDGGRDASCWEVDPSGVSKRLELDDHEAMLLALLVRSGCWLDEEAMDGRLEFLGVRVGGASAAPALPPPLGSVVGGVGGSSSTGSGSGDGGDKSSSSSSAASSSAAVAPPATKGPARKPSKRSRRAAANDSAASEAGAAPPPPPPPVFVDVALAGTRMVARVQICPLTWRPIGFGQTLAGADDAAATAGGGDGAQAATAAPSLWHFEDWQLWEGPAAPLDDDAGASSSSSSSSKSRSSAVLAGSPLQPRDVPAGVPLADAMASGAGATAGGATAAVLFPRRTRHNAAVGGAHDYHAASVALQRPGPALYAPPPIAPLPADAAFDAERPAGTWAWRSASGHTVVPVEVEGVPPGYMLLDTGASGLVLQTGLAARHGLTRFGRLSIAGLAGRVRTCFVRARAIRLGPLVVRDPVFMEMGVGGLVRGLEPGIIGIAGYDVFRRAVVEVPTVGETAAALRALEARRAAAAAAAAAEAAADEQAVEAAATATATAEAEAAAAAAAAEATAAAGGAPPQRKRKRATGRARSASASASAGAGTEEEADGSMRLFDAGRLTPLQRQLAGTAHAASVSGAAAAAASAGSAAAAAAAAAWLDPNASGGEEGDGLPPVPVPGPAPPAPGPGLEPLWVGIHSPAAPPPRHIADERRFAWHRVRLIGNLPHAEVAFRVPARVSTSSAGGSGSSSSGGGGGGGGGAVVDSGSGIEGSSDSEDAAASRFEAAAAAAAAVGRDSGSSGSDSSGSGNGSGSGSHSDPDERAALMMVDSGAGGADLFFHGRAARELRLVTPDELAGRGDRSRVRSVRGVGGEGQAPVKVVLDELPWAEWGGVRFERVRALFSLRGGLDVSVYSAGIVGADLLARRRVVVDVPRGRIGIARAAGPEGGGGGDGGVGGAQQSGGSDGSCCAE